ncbi:hypothetical protein [Pedobacter sp. N23S346]|uniref:hypothetical protein n=1 Tax=Pedobacter sp. N23S346 TaxID=3402750 RepID=UPI003AD6E13E
MCRAHARLIDANKGNYAAETLLQWKQSAEAEAYRALKNIERTKFPDPTTIICLNPNLMFEGIWKAANNDIWTFLIKEFIYGDIDSLKAYHSKTDRPFNNYVIVESQGDGRLIDQHFQWNYRAGEMEISVKVFPSIIRRNPDNIGSDTSTGLDGDIEFEDNDFKVVSGKEYAKQLIERNLSIQLGSWPVHPKTGSLFTKYYKEHKANRLLLNRLIKVEITRLMTIPVDTDDATDEPELSFINRVHEVRVLEELDNIVPVYIALEWGDGSFWSDTLHIHLHQYSHELESELTDFPQFIQETFDQVALAQMRRLTANLATEEVQEKVNPKAIMKVFTDVLPDIMKKADTALNTEIYPLFDTHILYRSFDNNTFEYNTSYDLELAMYQRGIIQQVGVTISLKGFKKAGIKAFDTISDLFIYFNDYNYMVGSSKTQPWLIKLYHQSPSADETQRLANQLINIVMKQINQKILETGLSGDLSA